MVTTYSNTLETEVLGVGGGGGIYVVLLYICRISLVASYKKSIHSLYFSDPIFLC
jgi:hypothetical protein